MKTRPVQSRYMSGSANTTAKSTSSTDARARIHKPERAQRTAASSSTLNTNGPRAKSSRASLAGTSRRVPLKRDTATSAASTPAVRAAKAGEKRVPRRESVTHAAEAGVSARHRPTHAGQKEEQPPAAATAGGKRAQVVGQTDVADRSPADEQHKSHARQRPAAKRNHQRGLNTSLAGARHNSTPASGDASLLAKHQRMRAYVLQWTYLNALQSRSLRQQEAAAVKALRSATTHFGVCSWERGVGGGTENGGGGG